MTREERIRTALADAIDDAALIDPVCDMLVPVVAALLDAERPRWQPIDTAPTDEPFIVCWADRTQAIINLHEYHECVGFGERPALGWQPCPAPQEDAP